MKPYMTMETLKQLKHYINNLTTLKVIYRVMRDSIAYASFSQKFLCGIDFWRLSMKYAFKLRQSNPKQDLNSMKKCFAIYLGIIDWIKPHRVQSIEIYNKYNI